MADNNSIVGGIRYLPEELQAQILIRLPVKSLVRFELVCKTWQSLFRSRYFIQLYGSRRNDEDVYKTTSTSDMMKIAPQLYDQGVPDLKEKVMSKELGLVISVLGPLNSAIYCVTSHVHDRINKYWLSVLNGKIAFCNFSIRHMRFANPFPTEIHSLLSKITADRLLFGFGTLPINSRGDLDYRVAMIVIDTFGGHYMFVYSLKSGEWKRITSIDDVRLFIDQTIEITVQRFLQGCWHWMALNDQHQIFLLSFNFGDETFKRVNGPPYSMSTTRHLETGLFVLCDRLAVVYLNRTETRCTKFDVWMMMEYGVEDSWRKIYTINPNFVCDFVRIIGVLYKPRQGEEESDENESVCFAETERTTVECSKKGNKASTLPHPCSNIYWNTPGVSTYKESMERF